MLYSHLVLYVVFSKAPNKLFHDTAVDKVEKCGNRVLEYTVTN